MMPEPWAETKTVAWSELGARYEYCVHLRSIVCNQQFLKNTVCKTAREFIVADFTAIILNCFFSIANARSAHAMSGACNPLASIFIFFCGFPQRHNCAFVIKSEYVSQVLLAMQHIHRLAYVSVRRLRRYFKVQNHHRVVLN